jgi:hypothetical protein
MFWGCPVPGSEIASVHWSALRYSGPSPMWMQVHWNHNVIWALPDADMPQSPAGGKAYDVALPGGSCAVHLKLAHGGGGAEPARTFWIAGPRIVVRDLAPPSVVIRRVPAGWINATTNQARVEWTASDNFGSAGIAQQRVDISGVMRWHGWPGQGEHWTDLDLTGVGDGARNVGVAVDGNGTGHSGANATIYIDRTPPDAWSLAVGYPGVPGRADLSWTQGDNMSGVASVEVQANASGDGTLTGPWVTVATSGPGGGTRHIPHVAMTAVPDGMHAWRIRSRDEAGNTGVQNAPDRIAVDTTPPNVDLTVGAGHVSRAAVRVFASDNLQSALGLGTTEILVNTAADGSASGEWKTLLAAVRAPGLHNDSFPLAGLPDGPHRVLVRVRNGGPFGNLLYTERTATVTVDLTGPSLAGATFTHAGPTRVDVSFTAQDAGAGVASAEVQWLDGATWRTLLTRPITAGAQTLQVDTSSLPQAGPLLRLIVTDGAGNQTIAQSQQGHIGIDRTAPTVTGVRLEGGPPWALAWSQSDGGSGLGTCPATIHVSGPGTGSSQPGQACRRSHPATIHVSGPGTGSEWREVFSRALKDGDQRALLPVEGFAPGAYRVLLTVCDAAGNATAVEAGGFTIPAPAATQTAASSTTVVLAPDGARSGEGLGSTGGSTADPHATLRRARLTVRVRGARTERFGGQAHYVSGLRFGRRLTVDGRLVRFDGRPLPGREILVRGYRDRTVGRAVTRRDGRFVVHARPDTSGVLKVGVPAGRELLPARASAGIRVSVRPLVSLRASRTRALAYGAPVRFTGRLSPAPGLIGGDPKKSIVLEWLDPIRGVWRPVLNARVRRDGGYRFAWRFTAKNLTIPMRVRVPVERGWPLESARSSIARVTVR